MWLIMSWSRGHHALITLLRDADHVVDHALITWLRMHWSRVYHCMRSQVVSSWTATWSVRGTCTACSQFLLCTSKNASLNIVLQIKANVYYCRAWLIAWIHTLYESIHIRSDQISRSVVSDSLRTHELQHTRPPCPSPTPGVHPDSKMKSGTSDYFKDSNISWPWGSACKVSWPLTASFLFLPVTESTFFSVLTKHINH